MEVIRLYSKVGAVDKANDISYLRNLSWICVLLQYWGGVIYLFCSLVLPQSHEVAVACGVLAILIALSPVFYVLYHKCFSLIFSCISAFNLAPIWFLYLEAVSPGYDAYENIPPAYRMETFFWIALFQLFGNAGYVLFWQKSTQFSIKSFSFLNGLKPKLTVYVWLTVIIFSVPPFLFYLYYDSAELLWSSITSGRSGGASGSGLLLQNPIGTASSLMIPVNSVWQLTPLFGTIAFITAKNKFNPLAILCLVLGLLVVFVFFLGGSRGTMMFVAAPVLFFLFYYNWDRGLKFWISAMGISFFIIGAMEVQVRFRGDLLQVLADPERAAQEKGLQSATTFDPTESHRDNNMYLLCLMIKGYPEKYDFEGPNHYITVLVNPIPRIFWPNKPILVGAKDLSQQTPFVLDGPLFMGTTSLSYSIVGEAYQAGGMWGILVYSITYAFFFLLFDGVIYVASKDQPIMVGILGIGVFLAFWGYRAFLALFTFLYPVLLLLIALRFIQSFTRNENHVYSA